ncbi:hypothetical protein K7432_003397 [Basidiobolus ranarum]|uniref:Uncharacterized protein n=1 Tax=Basidiobolus ranarum TaxID=34480 RepID=A0ABR2W680_9FUNG
MHFVINPVRLGQVRNLAFTSRFGVVRFTSNISKGDSKNQTEVYQKSSESIHREWDEKLASNSEADVKADREPEVPLEQLQKQSVEHITSHNK